MDKGGTCNRNLDRKGLHSSRAVVGEVGPHNCSKGSQARGHSLRVDVGHLEGPWGTRHYDSNQSDKAGMLGDWGNPDHICMWGPRGCGHLENHDNRRRDG